MTRLSGKTILACLALAWVGSCSDGSGPCECPPPPSEGLIVSNPVRASTLASSGAMAFSSSSESTVAYVGMTPGTAPTGVLARVRRGNVVSLLTTMRDGGFRPLPVSAEFGDSIEVTVIDREDNQVFRVLMPVAARRPPVVVRTEPPPKKRDHPLNASIVLVFSKPADGATATPATIQLLQGTNAVAGTVRFVDPTLDATHLSVEFVPDAPLAAGTDYRLIASTQVRDVEGIPLAAADTIAFTTGASSIGPPASLHTSPDSMLEVLVGESYQLTATVRDSAGNLITDQPVTWSLAPFFMQEGLTVSATGLVTASLDGGYAVRASVGTLEDYVFVYVIPHPAASVTVSPASTSVPAYDSIVLTATVRDSEGRVTRYPGWPYTTTGVLWTFSAPGLATVYPHDVDFNNPGFVTATVTGVTPGSVTITATSGSAHATAAITVTATPVTVSVTPDSTTLTAPGYALLFDTLRLPNNQVVSGYPVTWRSEDPGIATVDTNGLVKGVRVGSTRIIATRDASSDTAAITVRLISLTSVSGSCGITPDGAAYCWGRNVDGELGMGSNQGPLIEATLGDNECGLYATWYSCSTVPVVVAGGLRFSSVSHGGGVVCGVAAGGAAYCWGNVNHGLRLPNGTAPIIPRPVGVNGGHSFASVSTANDHTCAITTTGAAYCWGINREGQLGDGTTASSLVPVAVTSGLTFASVSVGEGYTCGLTTSGAAYCWGKNDLGQLGDSSTTESHVPVAVSAGLTFSSLSAGNDHTCGLTTTGAAYCWGFNFWGQLGDSSTTDRHVPVLVAGGLTFGSISAGADYTCGVTTSGAAYCWGENASGKLGDGSTIERHSPVALQGGLIFASVSAAGPTCGVTTTSLAYCWGSNGAGALGNGTLTDSHVPVKVAGQP